MGRERVGSAGGEGAAEEQQAVVQGARLAASDKGFGSVVAACL